MAGTIIVSDIKTDTDNSFVVRANTGNVLFRVTDTGLDTANSIASGSITSDMIADGTVIAADVADGSITTAKIADGNVTAAKIDTVANTQVTGTMTTAQVADSAITTDKLADANVTVSKLATTVAGALGVRNLIINGDMRIAQRGTTSTSNGYQTVDRWAMTASGVSITQDQVALTSSDAPYSSGLRFACKLTNTSTSTATSAYVQYRQRIEAQNMAQSGWNYTDSSSNVTLSFWIKSSVSGQYYGYVKTDDGTNKRYNFPFDLVANTWKKVTVTISGHSDLQFDNNNGIGLQLFVYAYIGTDYTDSGALTETWETYNVSSIIPDFTSNWNNTASATMFLTGVQLEVGDTATPFEHRPYDMELARCQRYFCSSFNAGVAPANNISASVSSTFSAYDNTTGWSAWIPFPVKMRTVPSMTAYRSDVGVTDGQWTTFDSGYTSLSSTTLSSAGTDNGFYCNGSRSGAFAAHDTYLLRGNFTADAEL